MHLHVQCTMSISCYPGRVTLGTYAGMAWDLLTAHHQLLTQDRGGCIAFVLSYM